MNIFTNDKKDSPGAGPLNPAGYVSEIFCSTQGEGPYVGERQLFFRTAGCGETCRWCDTVYSKSRRKSCTVYPGSGAAAYEVSNPLPVDAAMAHLRRVAENYPGTDVVSITGGEPLEQAVFVHEMASAIKRAGMRVYLETNGVHGEALAAVLPWIDVVAMDIKLPSATRAPLWDDHRAFLARLANTAFDPGSHMHAGGGKTVFVKVVIDHRSTRQEVETAAALIASTSRAIPLVLQPESSIFLDDTTGGERAEKLKTALADCHQTAAAVLDTVRVVPQVHRLLNVM